MQEVDMSFKKFDRSIPVQCSNPTCNTAFRYEPDDPDPKCPICGTPLTQSKKKQPPQTNVRRQARERKKREDHVEQLIKKAFDGDEGALYEIRVALRDCDISRSIRTAFERYNFRDALIFVGHLYGEKEDKSTRAIADTFGIGHMKVHRVLKRIKEDLNK